MALKRHNIYYLVIGINGINQFFC